MLLAQVTEIFSNVSEYAVSKPGIDKDDAKFNDVLVLSTNPVGIAIQKFNTSLFDYHPNVKLIRDNSTLSYMFQFESFSLDDILKEIKNFNSGKNATFKNIPARCLNEITDIFSPILTQIWSNKIINKKSFS